MSDVHRAVMFAFDAALGEFCSQMDRELKGVGASNSEVIKEIEMVCGEELADAYEEWLDEA